MTEMYIIGKEEETHDLRVFATKYGTNVQSIKAHLSE